MKYFLALQGRHCNLFVELFVAFFAINHPGSEPANPVLVKSKTEDACQP